MLLNTDCAEAEAVDGGIVVRLNSLTDHQKFVALLLELDIFVREAQPPRVVIDLSGSGFLQSRTLGEIARLANTAARAKTRLLICSTNPMVHKVMTVTELDKLVTVCDSLEIAKETWDIPQNIIHATFNNEMQPAEVIMIHCPARTDESSTVSVVTEEPWRTVLRRRQFPNLDIVWKGKNLFARVTNHKILDSASTDAFRSSMLSLEADGQPEKFIIDFQEAWVLSNTVLGVLGELQHRMNDGHRDLCVCGLSAEALKNFRKTRLSEFVVMYDSVKDALAGLNKSEDSIHRRDESADEDAENSENEPES